MIKLPISAIVVSKNEGALLEKCLKSIQFCEEILVINLNSTDNTSEIADKYATKCLTIEPIPIVEIIHERYIPQLKNDWVLITDPDEECSEELQLEIINIFETIQSSANIGAVIVPLRYYFKDYLLIGTAWGGINTRHFLIHKSRFVFSSHIHQGRSLVEGFEFERIKFTGKNFIHHYWMTGYRKLLKKHKRYLKNEGSARFNLGQRTSIKKILKSPIKEFKFSYNLKEGYKDGLTGLILSIFWSWYQTNALIKLYQYQKANQQ